MSRVEVAIRDAITRGARKQVRQVASPLRRDLRRLRQLVRALRSDVAALTDVAARWKRTAEASPWRPEASEEETRSARLSPGLIQKLRARLRLSQAALARLVGVSAAAVVQWEQGRAAPAGQNRRALVGLRKLGRREVKRALADLGPRRRAASRSASRRKTRRPRRSGRRARSSRRAA